MSLAKYQPLLSISELAALFNTSEDRIRKQYSDNASILKQMYDKAIKTGKKVNGYTAAQLKENYERFEIFAI
jgi:DeoR/GlpR family transcriptional regulator of sugar metabolism